MQNTPEQSLESQLQMARPKRAEIKRVPLTPEEKAFLGEIMDKAVAAEKAGELAKAIEYYQEYKDELLKIKEKVEQTWGYADLEAWADEFIEGNPMEWIFQWLDPTCMDDDSNEIRTKDNFKLEDSNATELPNNFKVAGSCTLRNTRIKSLPENFHVGANLLIPGYDIENMHIPDSIFIGGNLYVEDIGLTIKTLNELKDKFNKLKEKGLIKGEIKFL